MPGKYRHCIVQKQTRLRHGVECSGEMTHILVPNPDTPVTRIAVCEGHESKIRQSLESE